MVHRKGPYKSKREEMIRHSETNHNLGVHFLNRNPKVAEPKLIASLEQRLKIYGPTHEKIVEFHKRLSEVYTKLGDKEKSRNHAIAARRTRQRLCSVRSGVSSRGSLPDCSDGSTLRKRQVSQDRIDEDSEEEYDGFMSRPSGVADRRTTFPHQPAHPNYFADRAHVLRQGINAGVVESVRRRTSLPTKTKAVDYHLSLTNEHGKVLLGRYKIANYPDSPMHQSPTARVYSGVDLRANPRHEYREVAIKIVETKEDFDRQLYNNLGIKDEDELARLNDTNLFVAKPKTQISESIALPIIRFHQKENILVMPLADRSFDELILSEATAGTDYLKIREYLKSIAKCIHLLHSEHKMVHGDLKSRNFVRYKGELKLIDFRDSALIDTKISSLSKRSTGFIAPELAKDLFKFDESKNIAYYIQQEKEIMKKLINLDRNNLSDQENIQLWEEKLEEVVDRIQQFESRSTASKKESTLVHPTIDVWSFGVLAYYLMSGTQLFTCDQNDDLFSKDTAEQHKLVCWDGLQDTDTRKVFFSSDDLMQRLNAIDLLKRCLHPDPQLRVQSMSKILEHSFFMDTPKIEKPIARQSRQREGETITVGETRTFDEESDWREIPKLSFKRHNGNRCVNLRLFLGF